MKCVCHLLVAALAAGLCSGARMRGGLGFVSPPPCLTQRASLVVSDAGQLGVSPSLYQARHAPRTSLQAVFGGKTTTAQEWKAVLNDDEIAAGDLVPVQVNGLNLLLVADTDGSIYCVANVCPHIGTPLEQGEVKDGKVICPLHRTAFSLEKGEVVGEWCPFPPLVGPLTGKLRPPQNLATFPVRQRGRTIEVLVDSNTKANFEKNYWKGLLDAQGKADGSYY
ncbi:unnamed protein product [Vitrella brassicaformis CCMP3155]|uniref:Rieske domain-containing protein n=1 Tax=Vitrella brassicaformis (strain CCMP3155) TaxID=1169540 RepID=A0A0G4ER02_VITBC|nr:unnamed protein product [Vitrella brassicaformis CCMP3155]|eukprot:CEM00673.1 unnamed protein product [Vitrella brassicaformis CCMP3155]